MSRRILIIDDEPDIREVASASLELTQGWQVVTARSGPAGIEAAKRDRPDAILLDIMMPGMDGTETFHKLREETATREIPILFMTAKIQPAERNVFESIGVDGLLPKPFDPMTLGDEVSRLLSW